MGSADQRLNIKLDHVAPKSGQLSVQVLPFAEVFVDGKRVGSTPIRSLSLRPGSHIIELTNAGRKKHDRRKIVIEAGHTASIQLDWTAN